MKISKTKIGDKHNELTVIDHPYSKREGSVTKFFALVKCTCGNEFETSCTGLRNNKKTKCNDCSWKSRELKKPLVNQPQQLYNKLVRHRTRDNSIEVKISLEEFIKIITQNCYYCGEPPKETSMFRNRKYKNAGEFKYNGIDRKDPKLGYVLENCVPCCQPCNYAKYILTDVEFINKVIKIYNNLNLGKYVYCSSNC
jgi:5-methylcytosine-specific restriction endonuclease McrA